MDDQSQHAGWIRVERSIFDHRIFQGAEFSERDAWLWLISNAAWAPRTFRHRKTMIPLGRGQLIGSRSFLASEWGWSEKRVRTFLAIISAENMITLGQHGAGTISVITICNYDKYQTAEPARGQEKGQEEASKGPAKGHIQYKETNNSSSGECARDPNQISIEPDRIVGPETANGPAFVIDLQAVRMEAVFQSIDPDRALAIAEQCARDWCANRSRPASPMASVRRAIREDRNSADIHSVRRQRAEAPPAATPGVVTPISAGRQPAWAAERDRKTEANRKAFEKFGVAVAS